MLNILTSYYYMHFKRQLMNQTWQNGKNLILDTVLVCLTQICPPPPKKSFFWWVLSLLVVRHCSKLSSYHPMQFIRKLMNQTWENGKILPYFDLRKWLILPRFDPNLVPKNFLHDFYFLLNVRHCQTWENGKKT